uniref:CCHC-type domain-containing protein n=1 Tax=Beta vulgaris subsp. vulgaris TaxID=3555 RepID=F4NCG7_BETVV|nr:hypothetical protein [Beta vulgaris subsp. vulgaris]
MEMDVETDQVGDHGRKLIPLTQKLNIQASSSQEGEAEDDGLQHQGEESNEKEEGEVFRWFPQARGNLSSFRDAVAGSTQWFREAKKLMEVSLEWDDEEVPIPDSQLAVSFTKETLWKLREPWRNTLMGKVLGMSISRNFLVERVNRIWKTNDKVEVIDLGHDVFLFKFNNGNDMEKALFGGPWFILNHYLMLTRWKPDFRPSQSVFDKIMVWIRFPELPLEYYDKEALFAIAGKVGKPIKVDYATDHMARGRYARVCIELDLAKALVSKVWVARAWQNVEYENLSLVCFLCGKIGHRRDQCSHGLGEQNRKNEVKQQDHVMEENRLEKGSHGEESNSWRMVGETTDDVACKGLPGKAMMTKDSQDVVAEENKQETTKLNNEGEDKEGPWIVVTNIKRRVGKGKEGNSGGHPRNGEGTSKTKGRYGKEIRGGTQLRTNLDLNNNRWRALAGKDQERERKGTEKQGNDLLSDKGKEVLRSEQKSGEHVGRSKKTALLIGERKSKSAIFEKEGLHGRFTSPQLPRSINTPSYQEVNTILSENLEPDISSCNGECSRSSPHSSETDLIFEEKSHDSLSLFDPSPTTKNAQPFPNFPHSFAVESPGIANDCREVIRAPVSLVPPHEVSAPQEGRTLDIRLRSGAKNSGTTQKPPSFHLKIRKPRSGGFKASKPDVNLHHRRKDRTVATRSGILPGSSNPPGNLDITGPKTRGYGDDTGCNGGSPSKEEVKNGEIYDGVDGTPINETETC